MNAVISTQHQDFLDATKACINSAFDSVDDWLTEAMDHRRLATLQSRLEPGKMLRSRLGLALCPKHSPRREIVIRACAATELIHTATLFHDDVIDGASLRRRVPTLWQLVGGTGAILMGDLFFSSALDLLMETDDMALARAFVTKVKEVCGVEMIHEIIYSGRAVDTATCVRIARGKTGPLFAFVAEACGETPEMTAAFEEAGYKVGTAYQLADDLLDEIGNEGVIGKTLGTDRKRSKYTLAQGSAGDQAAGAIRDQLDRLCQEAIELLAPWPAARAGLEGYIGDVLSPTWSVYLENAG